MSRAPTDVPFHPQYLGNIYFKNIFDGQLEAIDYPKVNVCVLKDLSNIKW